MEILKNCYILPINDKFLFYAPLPGIRALINKTAALEIRKIMRKPALPNELQGSLKDLLDHLRQIKYNPHITKGRINPLFLGFIPTRQCNGACNYCDFGSERPENQIMTIKMAVAAVDWYARTVRKNRGDRLEVHFFGGEPMVAREVVESVVHRTRLLAAENNLQSVFEISTNGQYTKDIAEFIGDYFSSVILSLDGFEQVQDLHRPLKNGKSSFANAVTTGKVISGSNAQLGLRACISSKNVGMMKEIAGWFCTEFNPFSINFEALRTNDRAAGNGLSPPDPYLFASNLVNVRQICKEKGIPLVYATDITAFPVLTSCPVGRDTAIISPDGRISNCYLLPEKWEEVGLNLDFGQIGQDGKVLIDRKRLQATRSLVKFKPKCSRCFCRWSCAGGCHVCNNYPGASSDYNDLCIQTRIIALCSILEDLGHQNEIITFLRKKEIMKKFALQPSDLLTDFN